MRRVAFMVSLILVATTYGGSFAAQDRAALDDWTILPEAEAPALHKLCSRDFPEALSGAWTPSRADVAAPEAQLQRAIAAAFARLPATPSKAARGSLRYRRQYAGFWRSGRRVLYVNGFAVGGGRDWRSKAAVRLCDGGVLAFGAVFDPDRRAFDSFCFNDTVAGQLPGSCQ